MGDGAGLVAVVPVLGDVVADEHVVEDGSAGLRGGAGPVPEGAAVVAVGPLLAGVLGVLRPGVAELLSVVADALHGVYRVADHVVDTGDVAPDAVDGEALADLFDLVAGTAEEGTEPGEAAVVFLAFVVGGGGLLVVGGGCGAGVGGAAAAGGPARWWFRRWWFPGCGSTTGGTAVGGSARAAAAPVVGVHVRVAAGRARAGHAGDLADLRLDAGEDLGAEARDEQRGDDGGDDRDEPGVLDRRLPLVPAPTDQPGKGEGAALHTVQFGERVPLTAFGAGQEEQDEDREEQLQAPARGAGGEVDDTAEDQPALYGGQSTPDADPALPAAPGQPPAEDARRGGVSDEGDDPTVQGVVRRGRHQQAEPADDGDREEHVHEHQGGGQRHRHLPTPAQLALPARHSSDRGHAVSPSPPSLTTPRTAPPSYQRLGTGQPPEMGPGTQISAQVVGGSGESAGGYD